MANDESNTPAPTVAELKTKVLELKELKDLEKDADDELERRKALRKAKEEEIFVILEANELKNFKVPGVLTCSIKNEYYVAYPQSMEDIEAFNGWLEEQGLTHLRKVNSQTYISEIRKRIDEAREKGELFSIPGVPEPTTKQSLQARKASEK